MVEQSLPSDLKAWAEDVATHRSSTAYCPTTHSSTRTQAAVNGSHRAADYSPPGDHPYGSLMTGKTRLGTTTRLPPGFPGPVAGVGFCRGGTNTLSLPRARTCCEAQNAGASRKP